MSACSRRLSVAAGADAAACAALICAASDALSPRGLSTSWRYVLARLPRACEGARFSVSAAKGGRGLLRVDREPRAPRRCAAAMPETAAAWTPSSCRRCVRRSASARRLRALDLPCDPLSCAPIRSRNSTLSSRSAKLDADRGREQVRRLVDVRGAHTCLEDRDRPRVLGLEPFEPARLPGEERRQPVEALLLCRQLGLEGRHTGLG